MTLRNLENQIRQLATTLSNRLQGSLPSNIKDPRRERKEHCKVINLRSGKDVHILVGVPKRRMEFVSTQNDNPVEKEPQQPTFHSTDEINQASVETENNEPVMLEKDVAVLSTSIHSLAKVSQFRYLPLFPQRFQKQKQGKQFSKLLRVLK